MFGDAFSPYLVGALADSFKPYIQPTHNPSEDVLAPGAVLTPEEYSVEFRALQYALFSCCFMQVIFITKKFTNKKWKEEHLIMFVKIIYVIY